MTLDIKTAEQLVDPALEQRWAARREARQADVLRRILHAFAEQGGPVTLATLTAAFPERPAKLVQETVGGLDAEDLVQVTGDAVVIAYPFCAAPTPFVVRLAGGAERCACCAIDALGIAPMLGQPTRVRARCHRSGEPLEFSVTPDGPGPEAARIMVWVEARREGQRRIATSL